MASRGSVVSQRRRTARGVMAPGTRALGFASRWFEPALVHRTFEPLIADWQREWYESAPSRRAWVSLRGCLAFLSAAAISTPSVVATPTPYLLIRRVTARIVVFCLIAADLLSIPMVRSSMHRGCHICWGAALCTADGISVRDDHRGGCDSPHRTFLDTSSVPRAEARMIAMLLPHRPRVGFAARCSAMVKVTTPPAGTFRSRR